MKKAVIFDMDGVLVDNRDVHVEAFSRWFESKNLVIDKELLFKHFGMSNEEIFPPLLGRNDLTKEQIDVFGQEKETIYREIFESSIAPTPGLIKILDELKAMGVKIAVGSSGMRKNVDFVLEKCGIASYFDAIIDGDQLHRAKPDPEVFLLGAAAMGVEPADCVVCEDSFAGIQAARSAGMSVVALATTFAQDLHKDYDVIIDDFTQITAQQILEI